MNPCNYPKKLAYLEIFSNKKTEIKSGNRSSYSSFFIYTFHDSIHLIPNSRTSMFTNTEVTINQFSLWLHAKTDNLRTSLFCFTNCFSFSINTINFDPLLLWY